ncbi:uncharacterized protein LOC129579621 [Sitodiplosis mosellana]|uniref:uncharacterized protein LOC129579621 n=1 Tax=Sitodiplosis mosellana TaxID=263140 RepID=UPI002444E988|nr:uncharacterized protein LOC129579621 [Sitodiplosis mosellana]
MDMEKIEAEFEFYGFTLEELKKEYERLFRLHCKRMMDKFTENVIVAAQRELTVETANKIKSLGNNALNLIKPETVRLLSKIHALVDKHLTIPPSIPISENCLQNTPDMDDYERKCKEDIAELELVYKQQAIMLAHLAKELTFYDNELIAEAETDIEMCNLFENHFTESNFNAELIENMVKILKNISVE